MKENRWKKEYELEKLRKKHARRLGVLSFFLSTFFYIMIYYMIIYSDIENPRRLSQIIFVTLVLMLGAIASFWHKKYKISFQQAAGTAVVGSMLSLGLLVFVPIFKS